MDNKFELPQLIIVNFVNKDIITSSGPGGGQGTKPGDEYVDEPDSIWPLF
ncbi:MAG: hypothetical protein IJ186_00745 [Bacilli bacterium]|nr:hypothetical protein [Bacilli bacterium]